MTLAESLTVVGRHVEAMAVIEDMVARCEANGDLIFMSELLRLKGRLLLSLPAARGEDAERCFRHALEWSGRQGARAWELRAATDYAELLAARKDAAGARAVLQPVLERFSDGAETADLKAAQRLLINLGRVPAGAS